METTAESSRLKQRLGLYTTAAAGAALASGAYAAPTLSPNAPASFTAPDNESSTLTFDIDGDGTDDLEFYASASDSCTSPATSPGSAYVSRLGSNQIAQQADSEYAALVSGSFPVGGENYDSYGYFLSCFSGSDSSFDVAANGVSNSGFFGVQFDIGGETHNAVLQMQFEAGSLTTNIVTACYGSEPGEPVDTGTCVRLSGGEPTAVPTGNVAIPLSLGLLALGGLALYRRQRAYA
jgi:MYXO-CTERM domain-containing protein